MSSKEAVRKLITDNPIFVASKTYCQYCNQTLKTLTDFNVIDFAKVLQLNNMDDGADIQNTLYEITGQRTVPNIFIGGKHIGGDSELQSLKSSGELKKLLNDLQLTN